jgi:hypothetical protein
VRLLVALPQLRDVGAAYVGPAPAALPLVDLARSEVPLLLAPDMVLAAPVWGNPYLNSATLRTLSVARVACVGDLRTAALGQLSLVDGGSATARRSGGRVCRGALRASHSGRPGRVRRLAGGALGLARARQPPRRRRQPRGSHRP